MSKDITLEELCDIVNISYNPNDFGDADPYDTSDEELEVQPVIEFEKKEEIVDLQVKRATEVKRGIEIDKVIEVERAIEVDKVIEVERAIEVVEVIEVERAIEVDEVIEVERAIEVDKVIEVERAIEVDKVIEVERAIEVERIIDDIGDPPVKRARHADPDRWQQNQNKLLRMKGQEYKSRKKSAGVNITKEPRFMGPRCSGKCSKFKNKLCNGISDICRQELFDFFWKQLDWNSRKVYVKGLVDVIPTKRKTTEKPNSRRKSSMVYHLKTREERKPVCKEMFLSTFGLGEWSVHSWVHKDLVTDNIVEAATETDEIPAKRTRLTPLRERQQNIRKSVQAFLEKLPQVPSHYCRQSSSKLYLEPQFISMSQVYDLYNEDCKEQGMNAASRQILSDEFHKKNLSLYRPRKDQCDTCFSYKNGNLTEEEYTLHRKAKDVARDAKQTDKDICRQDTNKTLVITMDMQALLLCPRLEASALYYKTKLGVHNFTLYNMGNSEVVCYIWHEGEGGLCSNEFTSCIIDYIQSQDQYDTIILWSDGCGYQNRNVVLGNALLNFAKVHKKTIIQKYLEKGHTQMEIDAAHSIIERKLRNQEIYCPAEYVTAIQSARKNPSPFKVRYLNHSFFKNYGKLELFPSLRPGSKAGDPKVNNLRCIRYQSDGTIDYKLQHDNEDWLPFSAIRSCRRVKDADIAIPALYQSPLNITNKKWNHLQQLKCVMPKDFHLFYDNLPHE